MIRTPRRDAVLVVGGDGESRRERVATLERAGYACTVTRGPREARDVLSRRHFALAVCLLGPPCDAWLDLFAEALRQDPDLAVLVIADEDDPNAPGRLDASGYLVEPVTETQLLVHVASSLSLRDAQLENRAHRCRLEQPEEARAQALVQSVERLERATDDLRRTREATVRGLARTGEYWHDPLGERQDRMGRVSHVLALRLGLGPDHAELIRLAAPLHDVGHVGVSDEILRRARPLREEERAAVREHPEVGRRILSGSGRPLLDVAAMIAWTHHERWDGSGYPRGLAGEEIPAEGRLAAVADVFCAVLDERAHRPPRGLDEAVEIVRAGRGSEFDPLVVDAFLEALPEIEAIVAPQGGAVRVLIAGDHEGVRRGLELLLRDEGFDVVGSAGTAERAEGLATRRRPDVAIIDVGVPEADGVELTRRLLAGDAAPRVLLYTAVEDAPTLTAGLEAGAAGMVAKAAPHAELVQAIRDVARGLDYLDPRLAAQLAESASGAVLSPREREILDLLARGRNGEEIAVELVLSPETVRTHVTNAMNKLAVRTRVHAVTEALRRREITL